jgi:hypothetical protein
MCHYQDNHQEARLINPSSYPLEALGIHIDRLHVFPSVHKERKRLEMAWNGKARHGIAWNGKERCGMSRHGKTWQIKERLVMERKSKERKGKV